MESLMLDSDDSIGSELFSTASSESNNQRTRKKIGPPLGEAAIKEVEQQLVNWNLEFLLPIMIEERIDLEALRLLDSAYVSYLCAHHKFGIGTAIKFELRLKEWQHFDKSTKCNDDIVVPILDVSNSSNKICVAEILGKSAKGNLILKHYEKHNVLNDTCRSTVLELVNNHLIHSDIKMSSELAKQISYAIVKTFPTEEIEMYYVKQPGKATISKVSAKYYNAQRALKNCGLLEKRQYDVQSSKGTKLRSSLIVNLKPENNIADYLLAIQKSTKFEQLSELWDKTKNHRTRDIAQMSLDSCTPTEILSKWPQYKQAFGYKLIEIDFNNLYRNTFDLAMACDNLNDKLLVALTEKIKETNLKRILEQITEDTELNTKYTGIFYLIHCLLPPVSKERDTPNTTKQRCVKYSIKDSQNAFFMIGATVDEIEQIYKTKMSQTLTVQPLIAIVGTVEQPTDFYVFFDDVRYKFNGVLEAIDCCFKTINWFNLKYPPASNLVWNFVQQYFYKVETEFDKHHPSLSTLMKRLNEI